MKPKGVLVVLVVLVSDVIDKYYEKLIIFDNSVRDLNPEPREKSPARAGYTTLSMTFGPR